jgi:Amidase/Short repeat of unknown function (DUF308)
MKQRIHAMAGAIAIAIAISSAGSAQAQPTSASPFQLVEASIDDIHMALRSGRLTTRQLVQGYLDRINAYDKQGPTINSVITISPNALAEADRLDAAFSTSGLVGPLHGIAILVKDEIDAAGMPTTLGTLVFKDYRPPKDAFVIDKLRKAGAIILGKTTLSEFAAGDTYGSIFGVTRNPYDLERTVGGSSGGSGAALASSLGVQALIMGVLEIIGGFTGGGIGSFILGVIYVLAGLLLLSSPIGAALALPLVFGVLLLVQGVACVILAFRVRAA